MLERPAQAELQSAIRKLEHLGDYQTYFGKNPETVVDTKTPHYQEYNYLHSLVTDAQVLVDHYDDTTWLQAHNVTNETFRDILEAMQHAYRGCSLIFGVNRTAEAPTTTSKVEAATTPSITKTTSTTPQATASTPTTTAKTVKTEVFTPAAPTTPAAETTPAQVDTTDDTTNEIAVPATGIVAESSSHQVSLPALIAVVIAGAVVASIAIAIIIRHEPRRTTRTRARRHY